MKKLFAGALVLCSLTAFAQESKTPPGPSAAEIEAMAKAGTPGDAHKALSEFAGTWETRVTMWPAPGMEPMVSDGVSENRLIMGGRYLEQRFTSTFMGAPFEGLGYMGYDNVKQRYWGTWMDNVSTGLMTSSGKREGKVYSFEAVMTDPSTGKDTPIAEKVTMVDADHHTMEMWAPGPDGRNYKMMEIAYTRKK